MKILLITILLLQTGIGIAQNIEITVLNKDSQPMPYAYILINSKPVEISNALGIALIPISKLAERDTISVSYLGASPAWTIYNNSLQETKKLSFKLDETGYMLNEVVVEYQDIEKLFKRSVKSTPQLNYNCKMNANFDAKIRVSEQKTFLVTGILEAENEPYSKNFTFRAHGWFHRPLKFITNSDTAKISRVLSAQTHFALNNIMKALEFSRNHMLDHYKPFYSYLGEKDNYKVFRISYPETINLGFPFQIILFVDKDTKYIHSVELEAISRSDNKNYSNIYSIKCDCEVYTHKKPLMNTVYLPVNLQYSFQTASGFRIEIMITNPSIKVKGRFSL
ncbi:MAG: hypothetical protein NTX93_04960 [Bacteroidia bacterium]|nr:hypothetical protein [Bacteroidia bacterium]